MRLRLPVPAHLVGKNVSAINVDGKILVAGVSRGGGGFIPTGESTLQEGDYLAVIMAKDGMDLLDETIAAPDRGSSLMKVVVTGAGAVGRHLAVGPGGPRSRRDLDRPGPGRGREGPGMGPNVAVVLGDACEPWVLEAADVKLAEVLVAATGDDEDNLVTSLLAKQEFAVPRVLARVNHPKNEWLFTEQWGVDAAVSPPHILTAMVEEAVTVGDLVRLIRLEGGRISIVEMTLPGASPTIGRPLYELRLPPDSAVVAILRDGHVVIPQPETVFSAGDEVVALRARRRRGRFDRRSWATGCPAAPPPTAPPERRASSPVDLRTIRRSFDRPPRRVDRHPHHPVPLEHQRQLIGERPQHPALGTRQVVAFPAKDQDAQVAVPDVQRQPLHAGRVGRDRHGSRLCVHRDELIQPSTITLLLDEDAPSRKPNQATTSRTIDA